MEKKKQTFITVLSVNFGDKVLSTLNNQKKILAASLPTIEVSKKIKKRSYCFRFNKQIY